MRTTLDLPEDLLLEAMNLSHIKTKTDVIKFALESLVRKEKIKDLKTFFGKIDLDIDLDKSRGR